MSHELKDCSLNHAGVCIFCGVKQDKTTQVDQNTLRQQLATDLANYYWAEEKYHAGATIEECLEQANADLEALCQEIAREARINELTNLDNCIASINDNNFHEYYIARLKYLAELTQKPEKL